MDGPLSPFGLASCILGIICGLASSIKNDPPENVFCGAALLGEGAILAAGGGDDCLAAGGVDICLAGAGAAATDFKGMSRGVAGS